jgi:Flp pilus assembly protein TadD
MSTAEVLKSKGTERYKAGDFKAAADLFAKAAEIDPKVPVYLSNLSAAQVRDSLPSMISSS